MMDDAAFNGLLDVEGRVLEFVSGDMGGRTFCGIDFKDNNTLSIWPMIAHLPTLADPAKDPNIMALVRAYYANVWDANRIDYLPSLLQTPYFGAVVNEGPFRPTQFLQQGLNDLGHPIAVDGVLGPATIAAIQAVPPAALHAILWMKRAQRYIQDAQMASQAKFLPGWLNRLVAGF